MSEQPPVGDNVTRFTEPVCKGDAQLGTACGKCQRCCHYGWDKPPAVHGEGAYSGEVWCYRNSHVQMTCNEPDPERAKAIGWRKIRVSEESADKDALIRGLVDKIEDLQSDIEDRNHTIRHLAKGVDFEKKMPNETRPIIRAALRQAEQGGGS